MSRRSAPTGADLHRQWLELVDTDGPFLAVPALKRVWPQGMPAAGKDVVTTLKDAKIAFEKAWEHWDKRRDDAAALEFYRQERDAWVDVVLRDVLGWGDSYTPGPAGAEVRSPDHRVTVRAGGALVHGGATGALVQVVDPADSLRDCLGDGWANTPIDRMEDLLRANAVPIGVVTDGRWWAIVSARKETMAASGIVDAQTWIEEPQTRDAFIELLQRRRLLGGKPEDRLTALFGQSVAAAEEITEALGTQVRRAVELLVQALSEAALSADGPDPLPAQRAQVYEAAVTVMMRVVFLLFAEERNLLPQSSLFTLGYGISGELDALDARVREEGSEALDATHLTWHRLLATAQALHQGASFEDIRLPSYGGSLFDPGRFPFLTERSAQGTLAITASDRVMLEVLRAVQVARISGEARRISFRDIDVEQIGYIYEGLLGYSCAEVDEVTVGLIGKEGEEPEIPLTVLEDLAATKPKPDVFAAALLAWVTEHQPAAGKHLKTRKPALTKAYRDNDKVEDAERALRTVTTDADLRDRLRPFVGIIRRDLRNRPLVVLPGGVLVVETPSRATAGAHYTPRSLAEEVVLHALEPLVYDPGPHQQVDGWMLKASWQILDLKIADIACGSGAFLVAAARYLAARLVEAWQREGVALGEPHDQQVHAIRTVVAKCLYGADINAMAVEMCKLSLWLVSLDPKLPFSFVDDKILHGNSLLGLTDADQLAYQHIDPNTVSQLPVFQPDVAGTLHQAVTLRGALASEVDNADPQRSATAKRRQWKQYRNLIKDLTEVGDAVIAAGLRHGGKPGKRLNEEYANLSIALSAAHEGDRAMLDGILTAGLTPTVPTDYERWQPLHWILMVPDVMERGGFDAVIGNPPFLGGPGLTHAIGSNVRSWLVETIAGGMRGKVDIVTYFLLRAVSLLNDKGALGLIATNSICQGVNREIGLDQVVENGFTLTRSIKSRSWPVSTANLEYAAVWGSRGAVASAIPRVTDGVTAYRITTMLEPAGRVDGRPARLVENLKTAYEGCKLMGMGFVISRDEALRWIEQESANADVLTPYLNGSDLYSRPDCTASRWAVDFYGKTRIEAEHYRLPYMHVDATVKSERQGKSKAYRDAPWWLFARTAPAMRSAISGLDEVLAITRVSRTVMPVRVSSSQVLSDSLTVLALSSFADQAILSSNMHQLWAIKFGSGMRNDPRYTPSSCFLMSYDQCTIGNDILWLGLSK